MFQSFSTMENAYNPWNYCAIVLTNTRFYFCNPKGFTENFTVVAKKFLYQNLAIAHAYDPYLDNIVATFAALNLVKSLQIKA